MCHIAGLKGKQCSNLSDGLCAPGRRDFAQSNLALVSWSAPNDTTTPTKGSSA